MAEKKDTSPLDDVIKKIEERGFTIVLGKDLRLKVDKEKDLSIEIGKKKGPGIRVDIGSGLKPELKTYGSTAIPAKNGAYKNERMENIEILRDCMSHTDDEVFKALCFFDRKKLSESPLASLEKGRQLFASSWRLISKTYKEGDRDFFSLVFGRPRKYSWYSWNSFSQERFDAFVHETERQLRKYLKAGRNLKEKPSESWAGYYVSTVIKADMLEAEAAKRKVDIDFGSLDRIRSDAKVTEDWLLTEEDLKEDIEEKPSEKKEEETAFAGLDRIHLSIVEALILDGCADEIIKENRMFASVAADRINEAFFDEIGDNVLECADGRLSLVEEYIDDVRNIIGV